MVPAAEQLLLHLERHLGPLDEPRSVSEDALREAGGAFAILCFESAKITSYATFGLSRHLLAPGRDARSVAQEFVVSVDDRGYAIDVLRTLGPHVLEEHQAFSPGERHELPGWRSDSQIQGVLAVPDETLPPFQKADVSVEFVRLLSITAAEAAHARRNGWEELTARISDPDVDVNDLFRTSVV
jgi:hypothetical protein